MEFSGVLIDPTDREMDELISRKWEKFIGCCFEDGTFAVSKDVDLYTIQRVVRSTKESHLFSFNEFVIFKQNSRAYINWTGVGTLEPLEMWLKRIKDEKLVNFLRRVK